MIELGRDAAGNVIFVIWPHSALTWAGLRRLLCALTAAIAAIAVWFAFQGAWLVLPFAGLEALVVCGGIYLNARWAVTREVVGLGFSRQGRQHFLVDLLDGLAACRLHARRTGLEPALHEFRRGWH